MTIKNDKDFMPSVSILLSPCEAHCLLDYFTGSRGKEQQAAYAEFRQRLHDTAAREVSK